MNRKELYEYLVSEFTLDVRSKWLIDAMLKMIEQVEPEKERQLYMAYSVLDTIGCSKEEIERFFMEEPESPLVKAFMKGTPEDAAAVAENSVNSFSFNPVNMEQELLESPVASIFTAVCVVWVNIWGSPEPAGYVDGRNEYAVKTCKAVKSLDCWEPFTVACNNAEWEQKWAHNFVSASKRWHKTLMQSFSSVVLCSLDILDEDIHNAMQKEEGISDWWAMPFV